ncbi:DUF1102 domain-containing protein [Halorubrum ezzemoulense]|uniref:DUF1102 domain-containing protein n=1 Tax=Halorubrum ezzemoulense TaxID=337243 RepID=A0A256J2U8_HALEZ|nr:DUF1102 domain-containing protein [Halorubrum ezzemoulense]OYR62886.1 hypothetical protein DJ80_09180 [Halorubrum ezzemoulense]
MKRRNVLAALGMISGGAAIASGTGAFTSVEADRDVAVQVATDSSAFLALRAIGDNAPYMSTSNGQLGIDLTSGNATGAGGQGVNTNAVTVFEDMFEVRNQGTQDVEVEITPLTFVETDSGNTLIVLIVPETGFPSVTVSPGDGETYSLVVDVFPGGTSPNLELDDTMTVTGEVP